MRVKVFRVWPKNDPSLYFFVDAPNKRIAKWCGANIVNQQYVTFLSAKDMAVARFEIAKEVA